MAIFNCKKKKKNEQSNKLQEIKLWWQSLELSDRTYIPIFVLNCLVFGLWRIPRAAPMMIQHFASNPAAGTIYYNLYVDINLINLTMFFNSQIMFTYVFFNVQSLFIMAFMCKYVCVA